MRKSIFYILIFIIIPEFLQAGMLAKNYTSVVVGKPLNKTPVFRDKIRYIEFNPTWTQPTSIVKNETIPKLKKDSTYLEKNHFVLLDHKGNLVPTSGLDLKNLSASRFPYLVRQEPGPWNALQDLRD